MLLKTILAVSICVLHMVGTAFGQNVTIIPTGHPMINISYAMGQMDGEPGILFEIRALTIGWIGFGISNSSCMFGTDAMVTYIDWNDLTLTVEDYTLIDPTHISEDESKEWHVLSLQWLEDNTVTLLRFYRKLNTGDPVDIVIEDKMQTLVFAIGEFPVLHRHGTDRSGNIPFNLIQGTNNGVTPSCANKQSNLQEPVL